LASLGGIRLLDEGAQGHYTQQASGSTLVSAMTLGTPLVMVGLGQCSVWPTIVPALARLRDAYALKKRMSGAMNLTPLTRLARD
jgi:hypothetical protein